MEWLFAPDWVDLFVPRRSLLEIVLRGTVVYLGLFLLMRGVLKRQAGGVSLTDLLLLVLLADASQNAMAFEYRSLTEGAVLVTTLVFWAYALNWLDYHYPALRAVINPPPIPLMRGGRQLKDNMERELITEEELLTQLRQQGIHDTGQVHAAFIESTGQISVIEKPGNGDQPAAPPAPAADAEVGNGTDNEDALVRRFLGVADELRERLARHRHQADGHVREAERLAETLRRFGLAVDRIADQGKKSGENSVKV